MWLGADEWGEEGVECGDDFCEFLFWEFIFAEEGIPLSGFGWIFSKGRKETNGGVFGDWAVTAFESVVDSLAEDGEVKASV